MKCPYALTVTAALLAPFVEGIELSKRDSPRVVGLPVQRRSKTEPLAIGEGDIIKRGFGTLETFLDNTVSLSSTAMCSLY